MNWRELKQDEITILLETVSFTRNIFSMTNSLENDSAERFKWDAHYYHINEQW